VGLTPDSADGRGKKEEGFAAGLMRAVAQTRRRAQFKERQGTEGPPADADAVSDQLGLGRSLDPRVRGRMESAFGSDFSSVRVHDDSTASSLSSSLNARAFTVGNKIAFGAGEYQPGTMVGDALIAHELAHVMQQGAATQTGAPMLKGDGDYDALEADADVSAIGAVASLWTGAKGRLSDIARNASPRLKSGLKLQRCTGEKCETGSWAVINRAQLAGGCDCTWACVSTSSGPSIEDPNRVRRSNPSPKHTAGVGGQNPRTMEGVCYCMPLKDSEGNILGTDLPASPDQDYTAAAQAAAGMTQGTYHPEPTTDIKPRAAIIDKPTPGAGPVELEPFAPKGGGLKTEPVKTEPVKTEPVKTEPVKTEPIKIEPVKTEPVKTEPVKTEPVKVEAKAAPKFPANEFPESDATWKQWPPPQAAGDKPDWDKPGGARYRYDRYRYQKWEESGKPTTAPKDLLSPEQYYDRYVAPKAVGQSPGEMGSPAHKALVLGVREANGIGTQTMGAQRPDAVGKIDQAIKIPNGPTVAPQKGARVLYEADNFFKDGSQIMSEGREQVRQFRKDNPDATIVVQDAANAKNIIIYEPGTQPPQPGPLKPGTPNKVPVK
jgi:hypothetical protein